MELNYRNLYNYTERNVKKALGQLTLVEAKEAMTIEFPGYGRMKPGDYKESWFATVFVDIRGSTERAFRIGPKKTFVTMHAMLPTLARVVDELDGFIVDYPGDGIMAHWELEDENDVVTVRNCVKSCCWLKDAIESIINPILSQYEIPPIVCGIGAAAGKVVVTKIGIPGYFSAKAIGHSINMASKYASSKENDGIIIIGKNMSDFAYEDVPHAASTNVAFHYVDQEDKTLITNPNLKIPRPTADDAAIELRAILGNK